MQATSSAGRAGQQRRRCMLRPGTENSHVWSVVGAAAVGGGAPAAAAQVVGGQGQHVVPPGQSLLHLRHVLRKACTRRGRQGNNQVRAVTVRERRAVAARRAIGGQKPSTLALWAEFRVVRPKRADHAATAVQQHLQARERMRRRRWLWSPRGAERVQAREPRVGCCRPMFQCPQAYKRASARRMYVRKEAPNKRDPATHHSADGRAFRQLPVVGPPIRLEALGLQTSVC